MEVKIFVFIILAIVSILILLRSFCVFDFQCSWRIVNCCPETAGAKWECVNIFSFRKPKCKGVYFCPQVLSPKPEEKCVCKNWRCAVE